MKNKRSKKNAYDLVYGVHPIIELLKAKRRRLVSLYTTKPLPRGWDRIQPYLPKRIPNIQYVARNILSSMAKGHDHMGLVALTTPFPFEKQIFDPQKYPVILLLDGIQDVGNLGGILRSAYCTGVDGVILCKKSGATLTPAVFKASAGLAEHMCIFEAPSASAALHALRSNGYHIYLTVVKDGQNAALCEYKKPLCLVIGNEEKGVSKELQTFGNKITLPQRSPDISYNASVATGIFLFLIGVRTELLK